MRLGLRRHRSALRAKGGTTISPGRLITVSPTAFIEFLLAAILDPRRSSGGEKGLLELAGKSLQLANEEAFLPDADGLNWSAKG